jgi:hypothetical protein
MNAFMHPTRARGQSWRTGIAEVLAGCAQLLRPGGLLVTVTKTPAAPVA